MNKDPKGRKSVPTNSSFITKFVYCFLYQTWPEVSVIYVVVLRSQYKAGFLLQVYRMCLYLSDLFLQAIIGIKQKLVFDIVMERILFGYI
jgi:hypothetical protein